MVDDIDVGDDFVLPEGNVVRGQLLFKLLAPIAFY